jgi:hypothetical protein
MLQLWAVKRSAALMGEPAEHFPGVPTDKGRYNINS